MNAGNGNGGPRTYQEVEVVAEHAYPQNLHGLLNRDGQIPDWARYYRHVFSSAHRLLPHVAQSLGVPEDAEPERAALALATSPGFRSSMKPGSIRVRRRTIVVGEWEGVPLPAEERVP